MINWVKNFYYTSVGKLDDYFISGSSYTMISVPNILTKTSNKLTVTLATYDANIGHKYYVDTRDINMSLNCQVKKLDYNSIINIKPFIESFENYKQIGRYIYFTTNNEIYFIMSYYYTYSTKKNIVVIFTTDLIDNTYDLGINYNDIINISMHQSIFYPSFIVNDITLVPIKNDNYKITNYNKLFLETNEIIMLNGNYFNVLGLNCITNYYELNLLNNNNVVKYSYTGYISFGAFSKNNIQIQ